MDADDVSHPDRLSREIEVFRGDPSVCLVGTLGIGLDFSGRRVRPRDRWPLLRMSPSPPFAHASIMFVRAAFLEAGAYRDTFGIADDTDMIVRLSRRGRVLILPEPLYKYRFHSGSETVAVPERTIDAVDAYRESLARQRGAPELPAAGRDRHAETLYYLAAMRVWAGDRPDFALTGGGSLPWSRTGLKLRILLMCARRSPSCARFLLRCLISFRDRLAGLFVRDGRPVEWRFE